MKKGLTELVAILDMSGSMSNLVEDTIGGYNSMLKEQQEKDRQVLVTTYVFNNHYHMLHDRVPVNQVDMLTSKEYRPSGCTALLDTMGDAIRHIASIHRYAREEDIPEHTVFFITTDGMENASSKYSSDDIKRMVEHEQAKYGWDFIYLASNIDAVETAANYGINRKRSIDYIPDAIGTRNAYEAIKMCMECISDDVDPEVNESWREKVDSDFTSRRK